MVAYNGVLNTDFISLLSPDNLSSDIKASSLTLGLSRFVGGVTFSNGVDSYDAPSVMPKLPYTGNLVPCADQEFFGDIIVWPGSINMGLVLSAKLYTAGVWNLTGYSQRLTNWVVTGCDGVTVTNSDGYPVTFRVDQYRTYQIDVSGTGSAEISGVITFNFVGYSGLDINITGTRLVIFSFEPNWRTLPIENLEWLTDIITAHNGKEQRLALRSNPRRSLKYLYTFDYQNKVNNFESYLWGWQNQVFAVPVWTDWIKPTASIAIGATTITVSTNLRDFAATRLAIIWRDFLNYEVVEILSLTSSYLTLTKGTIYAWSTSDRIIPIRLARVDKSLVVSRQTSIIAEASITFSIETNEATDSHRLGTSAWQQYLGLDILTIPPNSNAGLSDSYERDMEVIDYKIGAWGSLSKSNAPVVTRPYSWLLKTRQEIMNFFAFLEVHKGKQVPFWMPTWSKDIELMQTISASDLSILIKGINYTKMINVHTNRRYLIFYPVDPTSTPIVKKIMACSEVGSNELLTIDTVFGSIKLITDFRAISFLTLGRFDQDAFEITWHSDSIADVSTTIRETLQ